MSLLYRVIYATHANGSHHKLALDSLQRLTRHDADAWQRLFLKHVELYLDGSKAPDKQFKDFKNHVLHVRDKFWGGAPEKVESWYAHLVTALRDRNWPEAAWCAGVLSHYYTDPIHPFHTAQSEAENNIHRAVEWSINRAYDGLKREAEALHPDLFVAAPTGPNWLKSFVCEGAEKANAQYERLIAHYDINVGVVDPPAGLDVIARELVGDLMIYAADGYARVLERAIHESGAKAPDVSLSLETMLATLKIPLKLVKKKLANAEDRRVVEAMYDELMATGRVEAALPEDDRMVRDLHAKEVIAPREQKLTALRQQRTENARPVGLQRAPARPPAANAGGIDEQPQAARAIPTPAPAITTIPAPEARAESNFTEQSAPQKLTERISMLSFEQPSMTTGISSEQQPAPPLKSAPIAETPPVAEAPPATKPARLEATQKRRGPRTYLSMNDDVEAAPSIGPKTAARLYAIGIRTVADLIDADPFAAEESLGARHITADTIADWQDQAHLVMAIPDLRGTHAQILVGAGYRSIESIGAADPTGLSADVLKFASTSEGQRVLRDGDAPDLEVIKRWIDNAAAAIAA
ncbi:MAG: DUF4332 domain-containing protein [Hyphomicrobiaceae bacterium]|nr:DUF4332 domain-containing protein [Hyphomicrobiaceae bacterium]